MISDVLAFSLVTTFNARKAVVFDFMPFMFTSEAS